MGRESKCAEYFNIWVLNRSNCPAVCVCY